MEKINEIPQNSRVAIYGAGEAGTSVKHYIDANRPDLKVVCFFDEALQGQVEGIEIHHIKDIQSFVESFDIALTASFSNSRLMYSILKHYGIKNAIRLENIPKLTGPPIKSPEIKEVQALLRSQRSKEIFELIVNAHINSNNCIYLFDYIKKQEESGFNSKGQYLDFVNPDNIKILISGGIAEGTSTIYFLRAFTPEKIYAFEPLYQQFKLEDRDKIISESGKVEIIEKALFDKSGKTNIIVNAASSRLTNYLASDNTSSVETISIDEFVKERNIPKIDFIKMDIEGAEFAALKGAKETIISHRPYLAICIYHHYSDLFDIPFYLSEILTNYSMEVYHYSMHNNEESVLYAIPNELIL